MKLLLFILLVVLATITWWRLRARAAKALKVAGVAYLAIVAVRLAQSGLDQEQWQLAALSFAFFAALWGVAWLVTHSLAK